MPFAVILSLLFQQRPIRLASVTITIFDRNTKHSSSGNFLSVLGVSFIEK
jgi:hypothetical protein